MFRKSGFALEKQFCETLIRCLNVYAGMSSDQAFTHVSRCSILAKEARIRTDSVAGPIGGDSKTKTKPGQDQRIEYAYWCSAAFRAPESLPKGAVRRLSFGIPSSECFGFQAINGAGNGVSE